MKRFYIKISIVFFIAAVYTIMRYHYFGIVPLKDFLLFTTNKIVIFSAVIYLALQNKIAGKPFKNTLKTIVISLIIIHILLSLIILNPYFFADFFVSNGKSFSLTGSLALLSGVMATVFIFQKKAFNLPANWHKYITGIFILIHLISMGISGWLTPEKWYGMMPPITLLSFISIIYWLYKK